MNGKTLFAFIIGAAVGVAGAWYYFNKRYFGPVDEVIEDEEDPPKTPRDPEIDGDSDKEDETDEAARIEYQKIASQYTEETEKKGPHIIDRSEFNDGTVKSHCTYSYFEDGVFTDEYNKIVEDPEDALGMTIAEVAAYFETDEDDLLYVRNEQRYCDYEILREGITYKDPNEEE